MRSRAHSASPLAISMLPAIIGEFWECWHIARGDSLAENRAM